MARCKRSEAMASSSSSMPSTQNDSPAQGIVGRARRASLSIVNVSPQLGIWQAAGTAIAHAPNLTELRHVDSGGSNISFTPHGHSARLAALDRDSGRLALVRSMTGVANTNADDMPASSAPDVPNTTPDSHDQSPQHHHKHHFLPFSKFHVHDKKADVRATIRYGLVAFWNFFITPAGFLITIYCLNIVAWGAMLFFLLLKAAPAMNHPSADDNSSPRKIWLEISSQILNALFCVTGFGLAPWHFRDLYLFYYGARLRNRPAMEKLVKQNRGWFRPPPWFTPIDKPDTKTPTFTGHVAPPTPLWKLGFTVWMMVLNTLLQAVLSFFMWHYNRIERPSWATGTFIGLGCGVAMLAGLMSWWEGRKIKKIEGPAVKVVDPVKGVKPHSRDARG